MVLVCAQLFSRYAGRLYADAAEADTFRNAVDLVMASDVLDMVTAVLAILFVRRLTAMQGERAALWASPVARRTEGREPAGAEGQ